MANFWKCTVFFPHTLYDRDFNSVGIQLSQCYCDVKSSERKKKIPTSTVSDNERKGSNAIEKSDLWTDLNNNPRNLTCAYILQGQG